MSLASLIGRVAVSGEVTKGRTTARSLSPRLARPSVRLSFQRNLTPARPQAFGRRYGRHARHWLVGDERRAGIVEVEARRLLRLLAGLGEFDNGLESHGGHLERVLLRRRPDHAGLDVLHARAAAVD